MRGLFTCVFFLNSMLSGTKHQHTWTLFDGQTNPRFCFAYVYVCFANVVSAVHNEGYKYKEHVRVHTCLWMLTGIHDVMTSRNFSNVHSMLEHIFFCRITSPLFCEQLYISLCLEHRHTQSKSSSVFTFFFKCRIDKWPR